MPKQWAEIPVACHALPHIPVMLSRMGGTPMYELIRQQGRARRGRFTTVHGTVETPAFMNVATCGAIKGGLSAFDLKELGCQLQLCNTYHLHLRPGDEMVKKLRRPSPVHPLAGGPSLPTAAGFRSFRWPSCATSPRRGSPSNPTSTATASLWGRRRACASRPILAPPSPWPLTSASKTPPITDYAKESGRAHRTVAGAV